MTFKGIFFPCLLGGILFLMPVAFAKETVPKEVVKEKGPVPYLGREYRDPTLNPLLSRPAQEETAVKEVVTLPSISIQGIIWGGSAPSAIIDGQVVRKGDTLSEGIQVLDISGAGIKVLYRGKIFTILPQGVVEE